MTKASYTGSVTQQKDSCSRSGPLLFPDPHRSGAGKLALLAIRDNGNRFDMVGKMRSRKYLILRLNGDMKHVQGYNSETDAIKSINLITSNRNHFLCEKYLDYVFW